MSTAAASRNPTATVTRSAFLVALGRAGLVVARAKPTSPIYACVRMVAREGEITLTGTDIDRTVNATVPCDVEDEWTVCVPCHRLIAVASQLPMGRVAIAVRNQGIRITCGSARFDIAGVAVEDFPEPPAGRETRRVTVDAPALLAALSRASTHVSSEQSRPIINGILVHKPEQGGGLKIVATDGYRMLIESVAGAKWDGGDIIVPGTAASAMAKLFEEAETIDLAMTDTHVSASAAVHGDRVSFVSRLISGPYPPYQNVIPRDPAYTATVDRVALLTAVKRVAAISADEKLIIELEWHADHVDVRGVGDEDVGSAADAVACAVTPAPEGTHKVYFGPRFLIDGLAVRQSATIAVDLQKNPERAMALRDEGAVDVQSMIMPRREPRR